MSNYSNQTNNQKNQKTTIPPWVIQKAQGEMAIVEIEVEQAKKRIPAEYHDFLVLLKQSVNLIKKEYEMTSDAQKIGMYSYSGSTFVPIYKPYITVDGRIQMARDEHKELGKKLDIHPPKIDMVGEKVILSVDVVSEIYGQSTGMIEVGIGGVSVDKTNPFANAQTSAIGRALGFLGYGLVGTGIVDAAEGKEGDDSTRPGPSSNTGSQPSSPPSTSFKPTKEFRIMVVEVPTIHKDKSAEVKVMMNNRSIVTLLLHKNLVEFSESIQVKDVLLVNGWLEKERLKADQRTQPIVENKAS